MVPLESVVIFSTTLNEAFNDNQHPPLAKFIFTIHSGYRYFAKLDISQAYFQIKVDVESRDLFAINTHRVLY